MCLRQRRVGPREVGIVIREFAMLVSPWDARSPQRSLGPGTQLAVAARHSSVVYTLDARNGFPTCTFTQRTNVSGSLNHCDSSSSSHERFCVAPDALVRGFSLSTLHRNALFAQAGIPDDLCTSCAGPPRS